MFKVVPTDIAYINQDSPDQNTDLFFVLDLDTQEFVLGVVEINAKEGWLKKHSTKFSPDGFEVWPTETMHGNFAIYRLIEIESSTTIHKEVNP